MKKNASGNGYDTNRELVKWPPPVDVEKRHRSFGDVVVSGRKNIKKNL